jgi:hypothetical protein
MKEQVDRYQETMKEQVDWYQETTKEQKNLKEIIQIQISLRRGPASLAPTQPAKQNDLGVKIEAGFNPD